MLSLKDCVLLVLPLYAAVVSSLYEDQTGNYDWHHQYVGQVSYISVDPLAKGRRPVVVASETGVLAALNPLDGSVDWRRVFEQGPNGYLDAVLRNKFGSLLTVSQHGQLLRSWDISSGQLKYEVPTSLPPPPPSLRAVSTPLDQSWRPGGAHAVLVGKKGGVVAIASGSKVTGFVSRSGEEKWTFSIKPESVVCALYGGKEGLYVITAAVPSQAMEISHLNTTNGALLSSYLLPADWLASSTVSCLLSGERVWCLDSATSQLYSAILTSATPTFDSYSLRLLLPPNTPTPTSLMPAADSEGVWLRGDHTQWLLQLDEDDVNIVLTLGAGLSLLGACDMTSANEGEAWQLWVELATPTGSMSVTYQRQDVKKVGGVFRMVENRGNPVLGSVQMFTRSDQSIAFHVAMVMEDNSILLLESEAGNSVRWEREDGLGRVSAVQFLDLPADQSATVEDFLEKTMSEVNPVKLALMRWQLQAQLLKETISNLRRGDFAGLLQADSDQLVRDEFNTRKMIVTVTTSGKVYGLDSQDGTVLWQQFFPWLRPFRDDQYLLYILRTTSHPLHPPLAVLLGRSKHASCPDLALVTFDPLTGEATSDPTLCLPPLLQTFLLLKEDRTHSKILLMLSEDLEVLSYPSSPEVTAHLTELEQELFFFVANKEAGHVDGYYVNNERSPDTEFHASHLWHVAFPQDTERIISIVPKAANEHVSAVGRSRADRSIQYKYLNPNLVAVVTESTDTLRPALSVYLVDVVTGSVIFHTSHKAAVSPVNLVHSENWIVYHFFNSKLRRYELAVVELYEMDSNQTRTVWSSLTPPPPPQVLTQAYALYDSFAAVATTQTKRGITTKSILVGLESGHLAFIPKIILDPRREMEVTNEMKEASLPPYAPQVKMNPIVYLNYNQTVERLAHIFSTPSGLESTSLVLACGLDMYFSRVLPSKQFDLLALDFDYHLIAVVVGAMIIATFVLSRLSAQKSLKLLWK